ncbi:SgcJ/EcaC family oxidoreductase [Nocardia sp. GCM10030253]|uniref:SgcJ/EcaC family oxidoreductase n=1 Tax=Nocardia sp. GCM10030253 TaxID=3273404 RepID=UPI003634EE09
MHNTELEEINAKLDGVDPSLPDREALIDLAGKQADAWEAGDGHAFAATFTEDADFVSVIGEFIQGRTYLGQVMQQGFDGFMKGTRLSEPEVTTIRFPAPDVAVMVTSGVWVIRPDADEERPENLSIQTRTAVRENDTWLFTSFQNTRILPNPGAAPSTSSVSATD